MDYGFNQTRMVGVFSVYGQAVVLAELSGSGNILIMDSAMKPVPYTPLTARELEDLRYARSLLENPGLAAQLTNVLGAPIEKGFKMLPKGWNSALQKTVRTALERALDAALMTIGGPPKRASEFMHKMLVGASGGLGGAFGFATL